MSNLKDRLVLSTSDLEVGYKGNSLLVGLDLTIRVGAVSYTHLTLPTKA